MAGNRRPNSRLSRTEERWAYLFVAAPLLGFLIFLVVPLGFSMVMSFQKWDILSPPVLVGGGNFRELIADPNFWKSLYNTFYLMLGIPVGMGLSLLLALMLNRSIRGVSAFRVIYYIPAIVSVVAAAQMWMLVFNADSGIINTFLWNVLRVQGPYWLGRAAFIKIPMIVMNVWAGMGTTMLFYLAGLQAIPASLYEAADLDGANAWQKLRFIILPKLTPTSFFILVTGVIGGLQAMTQSYIMAGPIGGGSGAVGGPEYAAATVMFYLWQNAFSYFRMGYACAVAWTVALLILLLSLANFRLSRLWVTYD